MTLNITFKIKFKHAVSIIVFFILNSLHLAIASPVEQPVVAFAVTYCDTAYLIRLFESGKIEYRGSSGVRTLGKREAKISPLAVKDLLKKFTDAGSFNEVVDDRLKSSFMGEAIYLRQGNKAVTFSVNPLFSMLRDETFLVTNAKQWVDYTNLSRCRKYDYGIQKIEINKLKFIEN